MIFRFSLYGFLKNQRYFEAFLFLAFMAKGLDFFQIGLLVAGRQLAVNLIEIPSGSIADVFGRRKTMLLSLTAYMVGFVVLGAAEQIGGLAAGMALLGIGDSFRSGTHKAMIFRWLLLNDREGERVEVYGYTRSWSKFGSAVSVVVGAAIVLVTDNYSYVFYATAIPYVLGIINIVGYPEDLDGGAETGRSLSGVVRHLLDSVGSAFRRRSLRRLIGESMGFDGVFAAVKDYLQPVLKAFAITTAATLFASSQLSETQWTALMVGLVYIVLYLLAGLASRLAYRIAAAAGGEDASGRVLWGMNAVVFIGVFAAAWYEVSVPLVAAFVLLHILHNLWRPILISRFDAHGDESQGASLLSIESQAQRVATMVLAPLLGLAVDWVRNGGPGGRFWPVGAAGAVISIAFFATTLTRRDASAS